jgi:hypothetical protein
MIDHHHRHAEPPRFGQCLEAGGAAIDGHQQRRALGGQRADGFGVGTIALKQPIGDVDQRIEAAMAQMPGEQRGRGRAIDVIVTEDRDLLGPHGCIRNTLGGRLHLRHCGRVRHHLADGGIKKIRHRVEIDVAPGHQPRQHFRKLIALHHRERPCGATRVEPVAPQFPGQGSGHTEKGRLRLDR